MTLKMMFLTKTDNYFLKKKKKGMTQTENVTKMGVIIKGVYYT
jgi:hypothetical protein